MSDLRYTLVGDGPFDRVLLRHIEWLLRLHVGESVALQPQWADLRAVHEKPKGLAEKLAPRTTFMNAIFCSFTATQNGKIPPREWRRSETP